MSKDILKDALEDVLNESYEEMTGLDIPDYDFSDNFKEKMEKLTAAPEEKAEKKLRGIGRIAVSVLTAAAAGLCIWTGVKNTPRISQKISDTGNIITATDPPYEKPAVSDAEVQTSAVTSAGTNTVTTRSSAETPERTTGAVTDHSAFTTSAVSVNTKTASGRATTASSGNKTPATRFTVTSEPEDPPSAAVTTVTGTIDTDLQMHISEYERSIAMKKFLAMTAAAATIANVTPTNVLAVYQPPQPTQAELEYYDNFESGKWKVDLNDDGIFDTQDIFTLYLTTQGTIPKLGYDGDINKDETLSIDDIILLEKYYLYKNGFDPADFIIYKYKGPEGETTIDSYEFVEQFKELAANEGDLYQYISDVIQTKNTDLDLNSDGTVDIYDTFDFYLYYCDFYYRDMGDLYKVIDDSYSETFENCRKLRNTFLFDRSIDEDLVKYMIYNADFSVEWLNRNIYTDYFNGKLKVSYEDLNDSTKDGFVLITRSFAAMMKSAALDAGVATVRDDSAKIDQFMNAEFDDKFWEYYDVYDEAVMNGTLPPPDVNGDGKTDSDDRDALYTYMGDISMLSTAEESTLDFITWTYIDTQFDLNEDGVFGDVYDIMMGSTIILKYGDIILTKKLKEYNANQDKKEQISQISHIKYLEAQSGVAVKRSGDVDGNSQLKMNDAVIIMQSISNPDKYTLDEWAEFTGDVYNTGDGITPMDALEIQNMLLQ